MKKGRDFLKTLRSSFSTFHHHHKPCAPPKLSQMDPSDRYCYNPTLRWNPQVEEYFVKAYGAEHFARISNALTRPSCYSCIRVNTLRSTSDAVISKLLAILQENGCHNKTSEGANTLNHSDAVLPSHSNPKFVVSKCEISNLDYVVFFRGSGPHTIVYGFKDDKTPKEVIVSRKCAEAVLRGAQVFVPGVLACSAHVEKGELVAVSVSVEQPGADGGWSVGFTRGTVMQGSETDPYYSERSGLYIGRGTAMLSRSGLFRASHGVAVDMSDRVFELPSFHNLLEGEIFLQNLPSIITAHALDPQEGEKILDMCAAPGGKTTAIAILMKDRGEIFAVDRSHNKVLDIQKLAAEMGLKCITTYKLDALKSVQHIDSSDSKDAPHCEENKRIPISGLLTSKVENVYDAPVGDKQVSMSTELDHIATPEKFKNENCNGKADLMKNKRKMGNGSGRSKSLGGRVEKSEGFLPNSFDRVLLDAPCSALGLRPRLFTGEETVESLRKHAKYQRRMFDQAVQLVRPGGVIVYSTCTINPGENEALVRYALDTYKFLSLASQHPRVGGPGLVGGHHFSDGYYDEWLRPGEEDLVQRFDPSSPLDTIGFFIAKFNVGCKDT